MKQQIQEEARMDRLQEDSNGLQLRVVLENQKNEKTCYMRVFQRSFFLFLTFDIMFGIVETWIGWREVVILSFTNINP